MIIQPLSAATLKEAIALGDRVFLDDADAEISPRISLSVSLHPEQYQEHWKKLSLATKLEYFVGLDESDNKVIGITGLYAKLLDPGAVWLGFYCIAPEHRGKGLGKQLLQWTINKARANGYTALRLYTTTSPLEAASHTLYEKLGFKTMDEKALPVQMVEEVKVPDSKYQTIFKTLIL